MSGSVNLIARNRLGWIPSHLRLSHEYSFFLHDESVRILAEYEEAGANTVRINFRNNAESKKFRERSAKQDSISAMRAGGYEAEARRVILNQITMGMASDCLHHIYEALRCLEKRKVIVALNLLRKPLTDSLLYLSWMLGDEDEFYQAFSLKSPRGITSSILKNMRVEILAKALAKTAVAEILTVDLIDKTLFERANQSGFQRLFQHAVHLVTVQHIELETAPENFNFIFKNYADNDLYDLVYDVLPHVLLYLAHVIFGLFARIAPLDDGSKKAFNTRSILGLYLVEGDGNEAYAIKQVTGLSRIQCPACKTALKITPHNAARLVLSESYRCTRCRRSQQFPFSWII